MIKAAVIGDPISHSLSPKIHNFFLNEYKINGSYEAIRVSPDEFKSYIKNLIKEGYKGFNITIPHKERALEICDHISRTAEIIGAINTLTILENGKVFGHNSDAQGFIDNLKFYHSDISFANKNAFIIGAGGAARAIIYSLINGGVKDIFITNRNQIRVQNLINDFRNFADSKSCKIYYLEKSQFESNLKKCDFLINSSSLGMENMPKLDLNLNQLNNNSIVYDIVYKPLITDLLCNAKQRNLKIVTGLGMLIFQALVGFEIWFGKKVKFKNNQQFNELCQIITK